MNNDNQEIIYCADDDELKYIVIFVINYVQKDIIKIILNHQLTQIISIKDKIIHFPLK